MTEMKSVELQYPVIIELFGFNQVNENCVSFSVTVSHTSPHLFVELADSKVAASSVYA